MTYPERITDELSLITRHLPVRGGDLLDLGCGSGDMTRRLVREGGAASALGIDIEAALPAHATPVEGVAFRAGKAEALDVKDASCDGVIMLKSLHHVPPEHMDEALAEVARVLKPGGALYVSEPVARGPFDEIMRNFHDEAEVRAAAQAALHRAAVLRIMEDFIVLSPVSFKDFPDFERRMMTLATLNPPITSHMRKATEAAYRERAAPDGSFSAMREFAVTVLHRP